MHDIRLALGLIGFLSVAIFLIGRRLLNGLPPRILDTLAVGLVLLTAAYLKFVWGQLWIVQWIPLPSVIVLSNWFPLLLAGLAAVVWVRMGGRAGDTDGDSKTAPHPGVSAQPTAPESDPITADSRSLAVRRTLMMLLILIGSVWSEMYFIPIEPPECGDLWDPPQPPLPWFVCRQTHPSTCSAASSATILVALGIPASEQEMARLCLTRNGTTWLGLYHGLATKLMRTPYRPVFFESGIDDLPALARPHPLLLCCRLDRRAARQRPQYVREGGWIPGMAHSVVYFGKFGGRHVIGDPSRGYEVWSDEDLRILWTGQGLRIVNRSSDDQTDPQTTVAGQIRERKEGLLSHGPLAGQHTINADNGCPHLHPVSAAGLALRLVSAPLTQPPFPFRTAEPSSRW